MPPKITDSRPSPEAIHAVEEQTAADARRIVATYADDFFDGVTLMSMLGVEPQGFVYKKYAEEREAEAETDEAPAAAAKKTTKKAAKKTAKKAAKKTAKKATKKATKKAAKKTVKKATKKATKKAAKKATSSSAAGDEA
ncbi:MULTISPECIES: histone [Corynebacterium]|uniref:Histone n=1 Tax=Corynebacterium sanguinis TaxID=2594913 RepID=A0A838WT52_9CORY|nr:MULTISPECIES: histone [Corynebacterium]MBA4506356.1 histone [Corynebacterium sanguinis]MCT1411500.1 histone [Corynebacterium sanguinis]MCT1414405.1 histone [Corynebacterium sanguinis]MCT1445077.1 histone [Corynebacterium sanguinis]MCT1499296.1 histone [Corynebacterium sanguinis]